MYGFKPHKVSSPIINKSDIHILKNLSKNKNIIICRPDKGRGVVIMDKKDYNNKMMEIINSDKFKLIKEDPIKLTLKIENKINYAIDQANKYLTKNNKDIIPNIKASGSTPGTMYGLPKVHKNDNPLRPVLAAYNTAPYKLAKWLVSIMTPYTLNEYTLKNSYDFIEQINKLSPNQINGVFVSFDVVSLFTNIPLDESIDIIINSIYNNNNTYYDLPKTEMIRLLKVACKESYFFYGDKIYLQTDGVSMGSPIGPTMANIFMNYMESKFLQSCPTEFKPLFYRRYVDDTFTIFKSIEEANKFLEYING